MRSSVALVYLRRFVPERGLSLRAAILSLANRLSHLLTRAAPVSIFKAICLLFSPRAARRITLARWTIRCSAFELRIQRKSVSFSSVERRISGAGRLISPAFSVITLSFARKILVRILHRHRFTLQHRQGRRRQVHDNSMQPAVLRGGAYKNSVNTGCDVPRVRRNIIVSQ